MKNKTKSGFTIIAAIYAVIVMSEETKGSWIQDKYQILYSYLEEKLNNFDSYLDSQWDGKKYDVTFGAELSTANGNRGSSLLKEGNYEYTLVYLDRLQALGVQGVKITIGYPLLVSAFPDSDKYLAFYTKLSKEIKEKRKMKLLVQTAVLFTESEFTDLGLVLKKYYKNLNLAKYKQEKREQIKKVLTYIQPDLLTVEIEPDTMAKNTGLWELYNPKTFREVIEYQINDVQKGSTLIGAGIGTWDDKAFAKELVWISDLDYLDLHIYPITKDYLRRALYYSDLAKSQNKKVISGEAWLYKATEKEVKQGRATVMEAFRRDVFSFWIPLDKKFHEVLIKLAHYKQFDFISPFWTRHYFAYLDYNNENKDLPAGKLFNRVNREAFKNFAAGKFTETALHYKELIFGDTSPDSICGNGICSRAEDVDNYTKDFWMPYTVKTIKAHTECTGSIMFGKLERTYHIHIPPSFDGVKAMLLVIALHGGGGTGKKMEELTLGGFNELSDKESFIVVYPDGVDRHWNDGRKEVRYRAHREKIDDVGFISALIDKLVKELNVDEKRVYATGMSNGVL